MWHPDKELNYTNKGKTGKKQERKPTTPERRAETVAPGRRDYRQGAAFPREVSFQQKAAWQDRPCTAPEALAGKSRRKDKIIDGPNNSD
jgi:hypothetical protein